jgi:hypothetical protein
MDFYDKSLENLKKEDKERIKEDIDYYNTNLRTGRELFIYEDLKKYLLNYYNAVSTESVNIEVL